MSDVIHLRLPKSTEATVRLIAEREELTVSAVVRDLVVEGLRSRAESHARIARLADQAARSSF
jgi:hypothetical protein